MIKLFLAACALLLVSFVSGCVPMYTGPMTANPVVVHGKTANMVTSIVTGEASVAFVAVDARELYPDLLAGIGNASVKVDPGVHLITVHLVASKNGREGTGSMDVDARSGHTYLFTAKKSGDNFELSLWDETAGAGKRVLLAQQIVPGHPGPLVLPIYV